MNKDVQRLREPAAWVLLGSVALEILSGLIGLLWGRGRLPFTFQAYQLVVSDQFFTGVAVVGLVVLAVLLVTRVGGPQTPGARNVVLGALIVLGVIALLNVVCMLAGLGAGGLDSGVLLTGAASAKITMFLHGLANLAVLAVGGYYVFTVFQSFQTPGMPGQPGQPYPQQGWGQPGAQMPYGQPGYGPPPQPQQQPAFGQQPPQQPYPQQGGYVRAPYGQPGYGPAPQPQQGARPPQPMGQQGPPPPPPVPPAPPQPPAAPQAPVEQDDGEGDWTRAYGTGETSVPDTDKPESSPSDRSSPNDSYRPPE